MDFAQQIEPLLPELQEFLYRIVAHPEDAADVLQETMLGIHEALDEAEGEFRLVALREASRQAAQFLETKPRWAPSSYAAAMDDASEVQSDRDAIEAELSATDFRFDVREHIAFCLVTVGRSLPATEACALQLRDVMGLSAPETAQVLGTSDIAMAEALAAAARDTLTDAYEDLCALQNPRGVCSLCRDLYAGVAPEAREGDMVELNRASSAEAWDQRLSIVREVTLTEAAGRHLHDLLLRGIARSELHSANRTE